MTAMKSSSRRIVTAGLAALAISAAVVLSCTAIKNDPPTAGDPTGTDPGSGTTPDPMPGTGTGTTAPTPTPGNGMARGTIPTPIETLVTPPAPEIVHAGKTLQAKLDMQTAAVPGTKVRFINHTETPWTARLEARDLTALRDLLATVSRDNQGKISFVVREQFDAYTGQTFLADVKIGADQPRTAVPTDPAELLAN